MELRMATKVTDDIKKLFSQKPVWTLEELAKELSYSEISVRRFLKQTGYLRSYTHNGKKYTLSKIPKFNSHGIWRCDQTGFSKHGTLVKTIEHLINKSPAGLSASELAEHLHTPCQAVLSSQHKAGKLDRIKPGPQYIYLSTNSRKKQRQIESLQNSFNRENSSELTAQQAVFALVKFIQNPSVSFKTLADYLHTQHKEIVSAQSIEVFFQKHHIKKNKICRI
jgi:hypothetical protein